MHALSRQGPSPRPGGSSGCTARCWPGLCLQDCEHCFNLAADMGGMGFIQSNHSVIL